ncbi:hypothetical protein PAHAL_3G106500 [Panicum hallii]|uniref:Uncharacterized protein n=1 Tax=Panicum hallii TaxID=206008 RepID=A0A2T8KHT3_9POAL|nr:hypothetical protein PAHAL_3G106500 [Panicum hallii]
MKHQRDHGADHPFGDPTAGDGFCGRNGIKYRVIPEAAGGQIWMLPTQPNPALPRDARDPTPPLCLPPPSSIPKHSPLPSSLTSVPLPTRSWPRRPGSSRFGGGIAMGARAVAAAAL